MHASRWAKAQLGLVGWGLVGVLLADHLAGWVLPFILMVGLVAVACNLSLVWLPLQKGMRWIFEKPLLAFVILGGLWLVWLGGVWATRIDQLPPLWSYVPFSWVWVWLVIGFLFAVSDPHKHRMRWLVRLVGQGVFTLVIVAVILEIALRLVVASLPQDLIDRSVFLPRAARNNDNVLLMPPQAPIKRYRWAGQTSDYTLYNTDGDLYQVSCLKPPEKREALYHVNISYSKWGFRETTDAQADLVVAGDSYTFAAWTPEPFWMDIVPNVLAMGVSGSGSLEQSMLIEAFAAERHPKVIVMAYFEGNDLQETWRFSKAVEAYQNDQQVKLSVWESHGHFRPLRFLSAYAAALWGVDQTDFLKTAVYGDCPYPLTDAYGNELAFYDNYVSMSTVDTDALRTSPIFAATTQAISAAADYAASIDAQFVLMFIPTTFHAHWQGIVEAGLLPSFGEHIEAFTMNEDGFIADSGVSDEEVVKRLEQNVENQRTLLTEFAAAHDMLFLDLTPDMQRIAAEGKSAYSFADTHWSNEGHAMVREILRQFLAEHELLPLE